MNTSGSSSGGSSYVSCIEVDGRPILPPIMTVSRRMEMRRYRELAIRVETTLQFNKRSRPVPVSVPKDTPKVSKIPILTPISQTKSTSKSIESQSGNQQDMDKKLEEILKVSPILSSDNCLKLNTPQSKYEEHFVIKKPFGPDEVPAFPSDGDSSSNNDSEDSSSSVPTKASFQTHGQPNNISSKVEDKVDNLIDFQDEDDETMAPSIVNEDQRNSHRLGEDDDKSESMSLVSLDPDEEAQRREVENYKSDSESDHSLENHVHTSGRSSTETFIIERHSISDSDNNNDLPTISHIRKYFFSPLVGAGESSDNSIVFNDSIINTTAAVNMRQPFRSRPSILGVKKYFDSPESPDKSPTDVTLTEVSFTTSSASNVSSSTSGKKVLKPPQNSPVSSGVFSSLLSSAREPVSGKKIYFSSPETKPINIDGTHVPPNTPSSQFQYSFLDESPRKTTRETGTQMTPTVNQRTQQSPSKSNYHRTEHSPEVVTQARPVLVHAKTLDSSVSFSELGIRLNRAENTQDSVQSTYSQSSALGRVNLVTLQSAMQNMSPSFYKVPPDARSSLLKGVVLMDPLFRPKKDLRIPPQALDPAMQPKFARISASVKGYLTRRILRTEKIQMIIHTIRDTVELVLKLYDEVPQLRIRGGKGIKQEDADLCRRLFQQLTGACVQFHDVFFKLTTPQRMAIIANDREKLKAKEMKDYFHRSRSGGKQKRLNHSKRKISTATVKCLARRMTIRN